MTLADGGMGDPCTTASQCGGGLECATVFDDRLYAELGTFEACTRSCDTTACPSGFVCFDTAGFASATFGTTLKCVPGCANGFDCSTGKRQGTCAPVADAGTTADGGVLTGICTPVTCQTTGCASGYVCQNARYATGSCGTGSSGAAAPPPQSWCGKN